MNATAQAHTEETEMDERLAAAEAAWEISKAQSRTGLTHEQLVVVNAAHNAVRAELNAARAAAAETVAEPFVRPASYRAPRRIAGLDDGDEFAEAWRRRGR